MGYFGTVTFYKYLALRGSLERMSCECPTAAGASDIQNLFVLECLSEFGIVILHLEQTEQSLHSSER